MKYLFIVFGLFVLVGCQSSKEKNKYIEERQISEVQAIKQDSIIAQYATNGAHQYNYYLDMNKWQTNLDEGLKQDSTIAYLWQQKAMPYFKNRKYEVGMEYLDKAVRYDVKRYLPYRAFIKCVFLKAYKGAIADFEECLTRWGDRYEMDHTYTFYIGLSYLQLNEFDTAEQYFLRAVEKQKEMFQDIHHVDLFYLGIVKYEQELYQDAINYFDMAIKEYKEFSDAYFYKTLCQDKLNEKGADATFKLFKKYNKKGYSINEANAIYELYPYQIKRQYAN
ncbi:tetratricopeptide repeat protein [Myroides odoratimimus]|uniref:Tetratricopeptide repeat protein n=1 Tax=Myroides odoratimimus TaxID=76832 RepID=A0AAI8C2V4_9FLAO|nr:hypothetical protein [Myroides odoratimimus]ALU25005.1 hypothetical protein AS202_01940 [Myroides odoratimimus]MCS7474646.1 hypothetical protein [Myroides odoratimimus]MDM1034767.1 hypothetical protein [Myroides odoratimimus]MDM1039801.1 hypothetical protein [Myroides odoratimimus]MDM1054048.1 hypothetical protein [Myroides odoratimimus]